MNGLGSGNNGEFTFLDIITLISFFIGLMNLDENMTQGDKQDLQQDLSEKADLLLSEIHSHLEQQDDVLRRLEEKINDSRRNLF